MFKSASFFVVILLTLMLAVDNPQTTFALVLTEANHNNLKQDATATTTEEDENDFLVGGALIQETTIGRKTFETQNDDSEEEDDDDDDDSDADSDYSDSEDDGDSENNDDDDDEEEFDIDKYKVYRGRRTRERDLQSGPPGFAIDLVFASKKITKAQRQGFIAARNRWQSIITQDFASIACVVKNQKLCGKKFTKRTCIDDLMIIVRINKMDGVGKMYAFVC